MDANLLVEKAERDLHQSIQTVGRRADALFDKGDYQGSLSELAALKAPVDAFFDHVMVNADDAKLRANRLALLASAAPRDEPRGRPVAPRGLTLTNEERTMVHIPRLVILGRDGILNVYREDHVKSPDEWEPIPNALEAVARLNHAGWHTVVATNQAGIGRGMIDMASINAVHQRMMQRLHEVGGRLDAVFFCPHTPEDDCDCRKPKPGLMKQIAHALRHRAAHRADGGRHAARPAGGARRRLRAASGAHRARGRAHRQAGGRHRAAGAETEVHDSLGELRRLPARTRPRARHRARWACTDRRTRRVMARALALLRSLLFLLWMVVTVVPIALTVLLASIVQRGAPLYWMCIGWLRLVIWGARWICGVRYRVQGMEHLPTAGQRQGSGDPDAQAPVDLGDVCACPR